MMKFLTIIVVNFCLTNKELIVIHTSVIVHVGHQMILRGKVKVTFEPSGPPGWSLSQFS